MSDQKCSHGVSGNMICNQCTTCTHPHMNKITGICPDCDYQANAPENLVERRHAVAERPFTSPGMNVEGYEDLARILQGAYDQSAKGKGKERHANSKPFDKQPIMEIARMVGIGGHTYQICKKAQEAGGMVRRNNLKAAKAELRGAIVYAAAAILLIEGMDE